MPRIQKVWMGLLTVLTLLVAALMVWQCISIYIEGNALENLISGENGMVYRQPVWSREVISRHFGRLAPIGWIWVGTVILSVILQPAQDPERKCCAAVTKIDRPKASNEQYKSRIRIAALIGIVVLIVLGILNGGMRDVFVKAANICTECIGLG